MKIPRRRLRAGSSPAPGTIVLAAVLLTAVVPAVRSANIVGVTPSLPPGIARQFEIFFGNDVISIGSQPDDFRTQQFAVILPARGRWNAIVDHSILTLENAADGGPGRIDQFGASLGYVLARRRDGESEQLVEVGGGLRSYGEYAGSRIQNGFHQLIDVESKTMPYLGKRRAVATGWLRYHRDGVLRSDVSLPLIGSGWEFGYWGRAATLVTTDVEWDGNLGLSAVATKRWFQIWLGMQGDWRQGYDQDPVTRATAAYEEAVTMVFGLRVGPFLIETQREVGGDSIYGHASLITTGEPLRTFARGDTRVELAAGLTMPDVYATLQGRWGSCRVPSCGEAWGRIAIVELLYGKPQLGTDVEKYVETWQASASLELERVPFRAWPWLSGYGSLGVGWRSERLEVQGGLLGGNRSERADRPGLVGELGLRFSTMAGNARWGLLLYMGIGGWLPSSDATVTVGATSERLQRPGLMIRSGVLLRFY